MRKADLNNPAWWAEVLASSSDLSAALFDRSQATEWEASHVEVDLPEWWELDEVDHSSKIPVDGEMLVQARLPSDTGQNDKLANLELWVRPLGTDRTQVIEAELAAVLLRLSQDRHGAPWSLQSSNAGNDPARGASWLRVRLQSAGSPEVEARAAILVDLKERLAYLLWVDVFEASSVPGQEVESLMASLKLMP